MKSLGTEPLLKKKNPSLLILTLSEFCQVNACPSFRVSMAGNFMNHLTLSCMKLWSGCPVFPRGRPGHGQHVRQVGCGDQETPLRQLKLTGWWHSAWLLQDMEPSELFWVTNSTWLSSLRNPEASRLAQPQCLVLSYLILSAS